MARQRLIDNVKEALGNVASQTRAVSGRAAKAVGWQAPKKGGATKAAAGTGSPRRSHRVIASPAMPCPRQYDACGAGARPQL